MRGIPNIEMDDMGNRLWQVGLSQGYLVTSVRRIVFSFPDVKFCHLERLDQFLRRSAPRGTSCSRCRQPEALRPPLTRRDSNLRENLFKRWFCR
jgi:hypothetical protein